MHLPFQQNQTAPSSLLQLRGLPLRRELTAFLGQSPCPADPFLPRCTFW